MSDLMIYSAAQQVYLWASVLWGIFSARQQRRIYGSNMVKCFLTGVLNGLFWPVCMLMAAAWMDDELRKKMEES